MAAALVELFRRLPRSILQPVALPRAARISFAHAALRAARCIGILVSVLGHDRLLSALNACRPRGFPDPLAFAAVLSLMITHNEDKNQFELEANNAIAIAAYSRNGDILTFTHTEVPEELEGQGVGTKLIEGALGQVREQGLKIVPICSFVRHYVDTHPETRDLLA